MPLYRKPVTSLISISRKLLTAKFMYRTAEGIDNLIIKHEDIDIRNIPRVNSSNVRIIRYVDVEISNKIFKIDLIQNRKQ